MEWKPRLRVRTKKDPKKVRAWDSPYYSKAGDDGQWDFFANRCTFQPARLRALMANQVKAMVRVAMMPGTAQAKLESSGMKARPDRPTLPIRLSSRKAARGR